MQLSPWVKHLLTVDDSVMDDQFSLTGKSSSDDDAGSSDESDDRHRADASARTMPEAAHDEEISPVLKRSKQTVEAAFRVPENADVVIRDFTVGAPQGWPAFAVFVDGMSDKLIINTHILEPLMMLTTLASKTDQPNRLETVEYTLLPGNQLTVERSWQTVIPAILTGSTAVFIDGCDAALIVETKGWEHRSIGTPQTEAVVRGPHDAFTESFRANTGLVRAKLRSERLVTEMLSIGRLGRTDVALMYIDGLTNPRLVREVKKRIEAVDVDYLADSGLLEQFLEDSPWLSVPQVFSTERPDRIAHMLTEGHVAIFVGNSPYVLAVPVVLWSLVHSPEDAYLRVPFGTFLRTIRWIALFIAMLLPSMYIAVTNYHPEMLPTDLLLAIAGSREQVPFPVLAEVLMMEFAIELIREAGIRIPSVIGPTIGIVGALIIGQSAVQAGIVSPLLVIVIAVTALASFTIPNYNLGFGVRVLRFVFLFCSAFFGFYGIALMGCVVLARLCVQKSFGVPLLAPVSPSMDTSRDVLTRGPAYAMNERPSYLQTLRDWRQDPITRPWSADTRPPRRSTRNRGGRSGGR